MFESDVNLYLTADGEVVGEGDERAATVLVAAGARIPLHVAEQYGLVKRLHRGPSHEVHGDYSGRVHEASSDTHRAVTMGIQAASKAGTPEGGDGYPSKHPELGREDFDEAHDEDPFLRDGTDPADKDSDAHKAAKESAEEETKQAEKIRKDAEEAKKKADAKPVR